MVASWKRASIRRAVLARVGGWRDTAWVSRRSVARKAPPDRGLQEAKFRKLGSLRSAARAAGDSSTGMERGVSDKPPGRVRVTRPPATPTDRSSVLAVFFLPLVVGWVVFSALSRFALFF